MENIMEFLDGRRTYRRFKQTPVPESTVKNILEAARCANCGGNRQALKYVVAAKPEDVKAVNSLVRWAAYLPPEEGTPKEDEIPVLFVAVLVDTAISQNADTDAGIAISTMTTAAWADGVGSCIMGAIDRPKIMEYMKIPETFKLHSVIAFGYPSHKSKTVPMQDGNCKYYLDENRDYCVPKRPAEEIVRYL